MVDLADQRDIVTAYCTLEDMSPEDSRRVLNFASMSINECNVDIFSNDTCENLLPEDYQNDIIEETVFKAVNEKIRVFRDVDAHIQLSLSYQFKVFRSVISFIEKKSKYVIRLLDCWGETRFSITHLRKS